MSLQNAQAEFAEIIFSDEAHAELCQPAENICIYRNNINSTLLNTLIHIYPMIEKLVGEDFFKTMANEYISRYPSRSSNLHEYGQYFGDFVAEYPPVENLYYLAEVAKLEWACHTLHFVADHAVFDIRLLEKLSPDHYDNLHFVLHPASQLFKFDFPVLRILDLCKNEIDEQINLNEGGVNLLVIRRDLDIQLVPLSAADFAFLNSLHDNNSLSESLEAAMLVDPSFNLDEKLPAWIKDKTIVDCSL